MIKHCPSCGLDKDKECFSQHRTRKDGLQGHCKTCRSVYRKRNPVGSYTHIQGRYGISDLEHRGLFEATEGCCEICRVPLQRDSLDPSTRPATDHCHTTGKVRGILCGPCNRGLGFFKDNQTRLLAAVTYLNKEPKK